MCMWYWTLVFGTILYLKCYVSPVRRGWYLWIGAKPNAHSLRKSLCRTTDSVLAPYTNTQSLLVEFRFDAVSRLLRSILQSATRGSRNSTLSDPLVQRGKREKFRIVVASVKCWDLQILIKLLESTTREPVNAYDGGETSFIEPLPHSVLLPKWLRDGHVSKGAEVDVLQRDGLDVTWAEQTRA